jgi:hypothetical protein
LVLAYLGRLPTVGESVEVALGELLVVALIYFVLVVPGMEGTGTVVPRLGER